MRQLRQVIFPLVQQTFISARRCNRKAHLMTNTSIFPQLVIPDTIAAGPGPGNTDARVLARLCRQPGVPITCSPMCCAAWSSAKQMLRQIFGTKNIHTFGVAGTGWSGLDCMLNAILPGDRLWCSQRHLQQHRRADHPHESRDAGRTARQLAGPAGRPRDRDHRAAWPVGRCATVEKALAQHKPKWAMMAHWETGSGRINDLQGFSDACAKHGAMGLIDAVSSLGIADFSIDDFPGVVGWASCPQKGILCLPRDLCAGQLFGPLHCRAARKRRPFLCAQRHSRSAPLGYHRWQGYGGGNLSPHPFRLCVAAFHEALRINLQHGRAQKAKDYAFHEKALRDAVAAMGCDVTSNMTSLVVLNLPAALAGREKELVQACRAKGFGIWPTLSEPVQVRIGILNLLSPATITDIVMRFGRAMIEMGGNVDLDRVQQVLDRHYKTAVAAK